VPTPAHDDELLDRQGSAPARGGAFAKVSDVRPEAPETWSEKTFLTFDTDWAHDAAIADTIDLVEEAGVAATWFVTHDTPLLARLRENPLFEIGIHPNFNPLLAGEPRAGCGSADEVLDRMLELVPEATAIRSHCLVQGGRLFELFRRKGLTHDCNAFLPESSGMTLRPWVDWSGLIRVPYFWEDDFWCDTGRSSRFADLDTRPGVRGYDFHPIHVFLNTEALCRYEDARAEFQDAEALRARRYEGGDGTRDFLTTLLASR
jgi:hypothetical protein